MKKLTTCLWFDQQAEEAAKFYTTVFESSGIGEISRYGKSGSEVSGQKEGTVLTVELRLENQEITCLNGGPLFKFTPSMSYFVSCQNAEEIKTKWGKLAEGGQVRMALDKYPWAEMYGWTADKYGVEWQLILQPATRKISTAFLFVDELFGKGEAAIAFYTSLFPNSKIESIARDEKTSTVMHCAFTLNGQSFVLMEGAGKHGHQPTEAFSIIAHCDDQAEIDHFWNKITTGGGQESRCGWAKDRFGVSWQIIPAGLGHLMGHSSNREKVMAALMKMNKIDIAALEAAGR